MLKVEPYDLNGWIYGMSDLSILHVLKFLHQLHSPHYLRIKCLFIHSLIDPFFLLHELIRVFGLFSCISMGPKPNLYRVNLESKFEEK